MEYEILMDNNVSIRTATIADLHHILYHRRQMFVDMGFRNADELQEMANTSKNFIERGLQDGTYFHWLATVQNDSIVAGGGIVITYWPTHPEDVRNERAEILNLYTEPKYRRRGIARTLMNTMIQWGKDHGFSWLTLKASTDGRALYESLGFKPTNHMKLIL